MNTVEVAIQLYLQYKEGMESQYIVMPYWQELSKHERIAWEAVAKYVIDTSLP